MHHLQAYYRGNEGEDENHAPQGDGFLEYQYAYEHCAYCPDACPDGVGRAYGNGLDGFGQKYHAENVEQHKGSIPQHLSLACGNVRLAQAEGETTFENAC